MVRKNDREYYFADWVSPSYELHGLGRLWKLEIDPELATWLKPDAEPWTPQAQLAQRLRTDGKLEPQDFSQEDLFRWIEGEDKYLADAAQMALGRIAKEWSESQWQELSPAGRVAAFVSLRKEHFDDPRFVQSMWADPDPEMRFEVLRWIADALWKDYLPRVESMLEDPKLDYRLFEATLATINTLSGKPSEGVTDAKMLIDKITHPQTPARIAAYALRLAPVRHERLDTAVMKALLDKSDLDLTREVVRSLAMRKDEPSQRLLAGIVQDPSMSESIRLDALSGLIGTNDSQAKKLVETLTESPNPNIAKEAQRVWQQSRWSPSPSPLEAQNKSSRSVQEWIQRLDALEGKPDPDAGRRIFFHVAGAACAQCHRHDGRGNVVGPDLSFISKQGTRQQILESIIEPSREVAPQFYTTLLELSDGKQFTGILLRSSSNEVYRDNFGQEVTFQKSEIENRKELRSSLMPSGLLDAMSDSQVRDLLAFLMNH
jgi:putative heme-binding domain-containing protein